MIVHATVYELGMSLRWNDMGMVGVCVFGSPGVGDGIKDVEWVDVEKRPS